MLYHLYQAHSDLFGPMRAMAKAAKVALGPPAGAPDGHPIRNLSAAYELIARAGMTHERPPFGIDTITVGNREVVVHERPAHVTPFGTLLYFKKDIETAQPPVLLVAPLSGHF